MLGVITYEAVLVLARHRIKNLRDVLQAKINSGFAVNDLERQIAFLAGKARDLLELPPHPPDDATLRTVAKGISQFAALGAVGLEIPRFAAFYAPSQSWLADTIHRGNPDPNREMVFTRSTDFLIRFWAHVNRLIDSDSDISDKPTAKANMGAYLLGHACHIAADVVANPLVRRLEWRLGDATQSKVTPEQIAGAIDAAVAQRVFGPTQTRGRTWSQLLPAADQIPGAFFEAYKTALEEIFGAADRRQGFKTFQTRFTEDNPPALSKRLLEDGYSTFSLLLERRYVWNYGDWLLATLPMFIPTVLTFPAMAKMPNGSELFRENSTVDKERGWFELLTFPVAANALVPLGFSLGIAFLSYFGAGRETIFGLVSGGLLTAAAITFFATLGADLPAGVRWPVLLIVPVLLEIAHMIYVLGRGGSDKRHWQLALSSMSHLILAVLFVLAFAALWHKGIEALNDENYGEFIGYWLLWLVVAGAAWLIMCAFLKDRDVPDLPGNPFLTDRKHFVRIFDRASLFSDPALAADRDNRLPTMAEHFFPSDRRPLLKIRWKGAGSMFVRSDRHSLIFSNVGAVGADNQTIMAPLAPMTVAEYARFLTRSVRDAVAGPFGGNLKVEAFEPADQDYELPPGEVFADHSELPANDGLTTQDARDAEAANFKQLPGTSGDPYILYHAPRSRLASYFGASGPVLFDEDRHVDLDGPGTIGPGGGPGQVLGAGTRFWTMFRPGDVISTTGLGTNESRVVATVTDDLNLTVGLPFTAVGAGTAYKRKRQSRTQDTPGPGKINIAVTPTVGGVGTQFDSFFVPGDIIRAKPPLPGAPQERTVVSVTSSTAMTLDSPFSAPLVVATPYDYERVGSESLQGFSAIADADDFLFSGGSLMDRAADLATLLCMGAVSHTIPATGTAVPNAATPVHKVYQVFRNWNLEERGVNEWKMLITGNATSEKGGDPTQPDPLQPDIPSTWTLLSTRGEDTANLLGWVPLLQKWTDMARRPGVDSKAQTVFFPGDPVNLDLSRAMAYLLDLADPDPVA